MRCAPPVLYPLDPGGLGAGVLCTVAASALLFTLSCVSQQAVAVSTMLPVLACLSGLGWVWQACRQARTMAASPTSLSWDGDSWWLLDAPNHQPGQLRVVWDFQAVLLLEFISPCISGRPSAQWLWVRRRANPACWADFRRAVYCLVA